jgi:hypothetical protein
LAGRKRGVSREKRGCRPPVKPRLVPGPRGRARRPDTGRELERRLARIRRSLYALYGDLRYFVASPPEHRERLRDGIDWPDVGHITSLARALAEEERLSDWMRFNGCMRGVNVPDEAIPRERSA